MKIVRVVILSTLFIYPTLTRSTPGVVDSGGQVTTLVEWNHKNRTLTIHGQSAKMLYLSLNAKTEIDSFYPKSTFALKDHERLLKQNKFSSCEVIQKTRTLDDEVKFTNIKRATCKITAPEESVLH